MLLPEPEVQYQFPEILNSYFLFCSGYAADEITHCVRPQDVVERRAVIILRRYVVCKYLSISVHKHLNKALEGNQENHEHLNNVWNVYGECL